MSIKLCCGCKHFNPNANTCARKAVATGIELVHGQLVYADTDEMNAWRERDRWFGCGKSGKYWSAKEGA
jgi:hypothetical protein